MQHHKLKEFYHGGHGVSRRKGDFRIKNSKLSAGQHSSVYSVVFYSYVYDVVTGTDGILAYSVIFMVGVGFFNGLILGAVVYNAEDNKSVIKTFQGLCQAVD